MKYRILVLLLIVSLCLGCNTKSSTQQQTTLAQTTTQPFCPKPYFEYTAGECCLDQNGNQICDNQEATTLAQTTTIPDTGISSLRSSTTTISTAQTTTQTPGTTIAQQKCPAGQFDNDVNCANSCTTGNLCKTSGVSIQSSGQTTTCYQCKNACPTNDPEYTYHYNSSSCAGTCTTTGWACFESTTYDDCFYCARPCPDNYYYNDSTCKGYCETGEECARSTQHKDCFWCKSPCPEGYYYKDLTCGNTCRIYEHCDKTTDVCYLCVPKCPVGYYYQDNSCNNTCEDEEVCGTLSNYPNCYYCKSSVTTTTIVTVTCSGDLYSSNSCDSNCESDCETCSQYQTTPCYYCQNNDCSQISAPYDLYNSLTDCRNDCNSTQGLCRQYADCTHCYYCEEYECGNGDLEPGEQCEDDLDCVDYHNCNSNCQCVSDCTAYCGDQGSNGYAQVAGITSEANCRAKMTADMNAKKADCRAVCGAYAWMDGLTADCCCVDTDWKACLNCPNQNQALIDCDTPLAQCQAGL